MTVLYVHLYTHPFWLIALFEDAQRFIFCAYLIANQTQIGVSLPGVRDVRRASRWYGALPMVARLGLNLKPTGSG